MPSLPEARVTQVDEKVTGTTVKKVRARPGKPAGPFVTSGDVGRAVSAITECRLQTATALAHHIVQEYILHRAELAPRRRLHCDGHQRRPSPRSYLVALPGRLLLPQVDSQEGLEAYAIKKSASQHYYVDAKEYDPLAKHRSVSASKDGRRERRGPCLARRCSQRTLLHAALLGCGALDATPQGAHAVGGALALHVQPSPLDSDGRPAGT